MQTKANPADETVTPIIYLFDGKGGAKPLALDQLVPDRLPILKSGFEWLHFNRTDPVAMDWLDRANLDSIVLETLTADETRPRCTVHGDGVILNLRGVNLNPGEEPEDMISIRLWVNGTRILSAERRRLWAVADLCNAIDRDQAPITPGDFVAKLALRLADRAEPIIAELNDQIDALEEKVLNQDISVSRRQLSDIRRTAIVLRRYMVPQRDALTSLEIEDLDWLKQHDRGRIREAAERVTRLGEDLDAIRDRAQLVNDQVIDIRAETMNRQMLVLSIVAAIFLPLGLVTGLLGINVGGIPGQGNSWAFWIVCALLMAIVGLQFWLFSKLGLIKSRSSNAN